MTGAAIIDETADPTAQSRSPALRAVALENYKCFRRFSVDTLKRINIIGGENNAGKSSLLEAIFLFHDYLNPNMFQRFNIVRGLHTGIANAANIWEPYFARFDMRRPITIHVDTERGEEKLTFSFINEYIRAKLPVTHESGDEPDRVAPAGGNIQQPGYVQVDLFVNNDQVMKAALGLGMYNIEYARVRARRITYMTPELSKHPNDRSDRFSEIETYGKREKLVNILRIIEPNLRDVSLVVRGDVPTILADVGLDRKAPLALLGGGLNYVFGITLSILAAQGGILLIDELENGIHYSKQEDVYIGIVRTAAEMDCQIFATTHSYEALNAMHRAIGRLCVEDDFCYIRLDRKNENVTPTVYDYRMLSAALEKHWEVR